MYSIFHVTLPYFKKCFESVERRFHDSCKHPRWEYLQHRLTALSVTPQTSKVQRFVNTLKALTLKLLFQSTLSFFGVLDRRLHLDTLIEFRIIENVQTNENMLCEIHWWILRFLFSSPKHPMQLIRNVNKAYYEISALRKLVP